MPRDFFPSRDSELTIWTRGFSDQINADPSAFGLSIEQAAQYAVASDRYVEAYQISFNPRTRTPVAITEKDTRRAELIVELRAVVRVIQASPFTTDAQRSVLGLPIRQPAARQATAPAGRPVITTVAVEGQTVRVRLSDGASPGRARPTGASGASIFIFVGDHYPADTAAWVFACNTTQTVANVDFPNNLPPGTPVWITARWYNTRAAFGPNANPLQAHLGYGVSRLAA